MVSPVPPENVEIELEGHIEGRVLAAQAVVCQLDILVEQGIDVRGPTFALAAAAFSGLLTLPAAAARQAGQMSSIL